MKARTVWRLLRSGRLRLLLAMARMAPSFYRTVWLAAAARRGLLARLAAGPVPFERLCAEFAPERGTHDALAAWLRVGERLGEIAHGPDGWRLRGFLARRFAAPENDPVVAICEEAAGLHHALLAQMLERLPRGDLFSLADQDGVVVARSSRLLEPAVFDAIDALFPRSGPVRLLEVGCGSGTYVRYAAQRNPALEAVGLELQPEVAEMAAANLRAWGLQARARIEQGDIRHRAPERAFDVVTLHNNINYFPIEQRVALFAHLRAFLRPGGRLIVTTGCQGGSVAMQVLDLWGAATRGCGRLPAVAELEDQMRRAGFVSVRSLRLLPGESYHAFAGSEPG
jgi:SAM-dependent methyltransferase